MNSHQVDRPALSIEDQRRDREAARESGIAEQMAVNVAINIIAWPCAAAILVWVLIDPDAGVMHLIAFLSLLTIGSLIAGSIVGWVAHHLFWRRSPLPLNYIVMAMALIVDLMLFGWVQIVSNLVLSADG
ncbi:MAG TPA: hypothetical protein VGM98_16345 [Schlesneria sp.]